MENEGDEYGEDNLNNHQDEVASQVSQPHSDQEQAAEDNAYNEFQDEQQQQQQQQQQPGDRNEGRKQTSNLLLSLKTKKNDDKEEVANQSIDQQQTFQIKEKGKIDTTVHKSLQQEQKDNIEQSQNKLKDAISQRSRLRQLSLIVISVTLIAFFFAVEKLIAQFEGSYIIEANDKVTIRTTTCKIFIFDYDKYKDSQVLTHMSKVSQYIIDPKRTSTSQQRRRNHVNEEIEGEALLPDAAALYYHIPGRFQLDMRKKFSSVSLPDEVDDEQTINQNNKTFVFNNVLSEQSCQINIQVYHPITLSEMNFFCKKKCFFIIDSVKLKTRKFKINGEFLEVNSINQVVDSINGQAGSGRFLFQDLLFTKSSKLHIEEGDVIVQSHKSFHLQWEHSLPAYCLSSPFFANTNITGCKEPSQAQVQEYLQGGMKKENGGSQNQNNQSQAVVSANTTAGKQTTENMNLFQKFIKEKGVIQYKDRKHNQSILQQEVYDMDQILLNLDKANKTKVKKELFPTSCFGETSLCIDEQCESLKSDERKLFIKNKFGNIYVNALNPKNNTIDFEKSHVLSDKEHYIKGQINWSLNTQKKLKQLEIEAANPKNFDPIFLFHFGSKSTLSPNFQQWHVTFNPAYSYMRPWWVSSFSFTLMSSSQYIVNAFLNPGFCPYVPAIKLSELYDVQELINYQFQNNSAKISTLGWQNSIDMPEEEYPKRTTGLRDITYSNNVGEKWLTISRSNQSEYDFNSISLDTSQTTFAAIIISIILSIIITVNLIFGVVYGINYIYISVVEQVDNVHKYSQIENSKDKNEELVIKTELQGNQSPAEVKQEGDDPNQQKKKISTSDMSINLNISELFRTLFILAPPLSAFIDYLVVAISKKYINSVNEFYKHFFKKVELDQDNKKNDEEQKIHDVSTEEIRGQQMKTLYEKFCYLNGYLEQKLDDSKNADLLKGKGFKIEQKTDSLTLCYTHVTIKQEDLKITLNVGEKAEEQNSMKIFIENRCKLSQFDSDYIEVQDFNQEFEQFCFNNHLQKSYLTESELKKEYNIESASKPQQWVVRIIKPDDTKKQSGQQQQEYWIIKFFKDCFKPKEKKYTYFIDKENLMNHFHLVMKQPEKIGQQEAFLRASRELIKFKYWQVVDIITVLAHLLTIFLLSIPAIAISLLNRVEYATFSLIPQSYLITKEDIFDNYWSLPQRIYNDTQQMKILMIVLLAFWSFSFIDLIYYYRNMEFPQEKFFSKDQKEKKNNLQTFIQTKFRQIMWMSVLFSFFIFFVYFVLGLIWLILGAIVNPTAFLPYATAAATFFTAVSTKFSQFKKIADDGFEIVLNYVKGMTEKQINGMMKKMNIQGKVKAVMNSEALTSVTDQAVKLGLVDKRQVDDFHKQAIQMTKNPSKALSEAANEIELAVKDPHKMAEKILKEMKEKAFDLLFQKINKNFEDYAGEMIEVIKNLLNKDYNALKQNLFYLLNNLGNHHPELAILQNQNLLNLLWDFAFPGEGSVKSEEFVSQILVSVSKFIMELIEIKTNKSLNPKIIETTISLLHNIKKQDLQGMYQSVDQMVECIDIDEFKNIKKCKNILEISVNLFQQQQISFKTVLESGKSLLNNVAVQGGDEIESQIICIIDLVEFFMNTFKDQVKQMPTRQIHNLTVALKEAVGDKQVGEFSTKNYHPHYLTMFLNFARQNFENLPTEIVKDTLQQLAKDGKAYITNGDFGDSQARDKNMQSLKTLYKLYQGIFELMGICLNNNRQHVSDLGVIPIQSYGVDQMVAKLLRVLLLAKYKEYISDKDLEKLTSNELFQKISDKMKLESNQLLGLIALLLKRAKLNSYDQIISFIFEQNKIAKQNLQVFQSLLVLFSSNDEKMIYHALDLLGIPKQYMMLVLINKNLLNPYYTLKSDWEDLGVSDEDVIKQKDLCLESEKQLQQFKQKVAQILQEINQAPVDNRVIGGNAAKTKHTLFTMNLSSGALTTLKENLTNISNNINKFSQIKEQDIAFLTKFLNLRNIKLNQSITSLSGDMKAAIEDLSQLLNIDNTFLEQLCILLSLTKTDKIYNAIKILGIVDYQQDKSPNTLNWQDYLDYALSKLDGLQYRKKFVMSKLEDHISLQIPNSIMLKILINKDIPIDLNCVYSVIRSITGSINYENFLPQIKPYLLFIKSQLDVQDPDNIKKLLSEPSEGLITLVSMLEEQNTSKSINLLLDYLQRANEDPNFSETYFLFAVLYIFFSGQSQDVYIEESNQQKTQLIEYLVKRLDLPLEFFEALHSFFLKDIAAFSKIAIRLQRRIQYKKEQDIQEHPNIPIQSLVNIHQQTVQNILGLNIGGGEYNNMFFNKELNIPMHVIDFTSLLGNVKVAKKREQRQQIYKSIQNNSSVQKVLQTLKVNCQDLITLLMLVYLDYAESDIKWAFQQLNMADKITESVARSLVSLTSPLPRYQDPKGARRVITRMIESCELLNADNMNLDKNWVKVTRYLTKGDFLQVRMIEEDLPYLSYPIIANSEKQEYLRVLEGIIGYLSCGPQKIKPAKLFSDLYQKILTKVRPDDPCAKNIDESIIIRQGNTLEYAIYDMALYLRLNPFWALLFAGDKPTWDYIQSVKDGLPSEISQYFDVDVIYFIVINFLGMPVVFKEMMTDMEWLENVNQLFHDIELKKKFNNAKYTPIMKNKKTSKMTEQQQQQIDNDKQQYDEQFENLARKSGINTMNMFYKYMFDIKSDCSDVFELAEQFAFNKQIQNDFQYSPFQENLWKVQKVYLKKQIKKKNKLTEEQLAGLNESMESAGTFQEFQELLKMKVEDLQYDINEAAEEEKGEDGQKKGNEDGEQKGNEDGEQKSNQDQPQKQENPAVHNEELANYIAVRDLVIDEIEPTFYHKFIKKIFKIVADLYQDPRDEQAPASNSSGNDGSGAFLEQYIQSAYFSQNSNTVFYQLGVLSTLAGLKKSYYAFSGYDDREEEHYHIVAYNTEYMLSAIEKYNYLTSKMDFFSKLRVFPIVGLSFGFAFQTDHLIKANVKNQLFNQKLMIELLCIYQKNEKDRKVKTLQHKLNVLRNEYFQTFDYAFWYKEIVRNYQWTNFEDPLLNNYDIEDIIEEPENYFYYSFQGHQYVSQEKMIFDCPESKQYIQYYQDYMKQTYYDPTQRLQIIQGFNKPFYPGKQAAQIEDLNNRCQRSGILLEQQKNLQQQFEDLGKNAYYLTIIDIFKGNSQPFFSTDSYLVENYPKEVSMYYGLVYLNGLQTNSCLHSISYEQLISVIESAFAHTSSNSKALTEILAHFIDCNQGVDVMCNNLGLEKNIFQPFFELTLNIQDKNNLLFPKILEKLSKTVKDQDTLNNICQQYQGNFNEIVALINYSKKINVGEIDTNRVYSVFNKLFCNFNQEDSHSYKQITQWKEFNLLDTIYLQPNVVENKKQVLLSLWEIACLLNPKDYQKIPKTIQLLQHQDINQEEGQDVEINSIQEQEYQHKLPFVKKFLLFFTKLIDSDFSILVAGKKPSQQFLEEAEDSNLMQCFKILGLIDSSKQMANLKILASLKPEKMQGCKSHLKENLTDLIQFMQESELSKNWVYKQKLSNNKENAEQEEDKKEAEEEQQQQQQQQEQTGEEVNLKQPFTNLIFGLAHDNLHLIMKALSSQPCNSSMLHMMQSLLLWKNLSQILQDLKSYKDQELAIILNNLKTLFSYVTFQQNKQKKSRQKGVIGSQQSNQSDNDFSADLAKEFETIPESIFYKIFDSQVQNRNQQVHHYFDWLKCYKEMQQRSQKSGKVNDFSIMVDDLELLFTGQVFIDYFQQKDIISKFFFDFFVTGYQLIHRSAKGQKIEIVGFAKLFNSLIPNYQVFFSILEQFINLIIAIQINNGGQSGGVGGGGGGAQGSGDTVALQPHVVQCMLSVLNEIITVFPLGDISNNNKEVEQNIRNLIKSLIQLVCGYKLDKNIVDIRQSQDSSEKIKLLIQILEQTIFKSYPDIRAFVNIANFDKLLSCLKRLSNFSVKTLSDSAFQNTVLELLYQISGQKRVQQSVGGDARKIVQTSSIKKNQEGPVLIDLPMDTIEAVLGIANGNYQKIFVILRKVPQIDKNKILMVESAVEELNKLGIFSNDSLLLGNHDDSGSGKNQDELVEIMKRLNEGKATPRDLFQALDMEGDQSGSISKAEFGSLSRRLGMNLTEHRINEIFASLKKNSPEKNKPEKNEKSSSDNNEEDDLNEEEFAKAIQYLQNKNSAMSLESLGISHALLTIALVQLTIILLLLFIFIFLGIEAFALGGTFGSIINSFIPIAAGAGASSAKEDKNETLKGDTIEKSVEKTKSIIESGSL